MIHRHHHHKPHFRPHRWKYERILIFVVLSTLLFGWLVSRFIGADQSAGPLSDQIGVHGAIPSLPTNEEKEAAINMVAGAGFGWMRHEFYYEQTINFENYDTVHSLAKSKGIKTLGLLSYPGPERSHEDWQNFVRAVVGHYADDVAAWEIMNEIDNYLSPGDYTVYLKEAYAIIRQLDPSATIVLSGITSRPESAKFWDGVQQAGGWDYFDAIGLHHYHRQNPERVNFGGGDLVSELSRPIATIRKNGDNKKIWLTEIGYIESVGRQNQANWLARSLVIARSIPEIEKLFIYTLTNKNSDFPFGLLDKDLTEFPVYNAVAKASRELNGRPAGVRILSGDRLEVESFQTLDGWSVADKKNGAAELTLAGGPDGSAMQIDYTFTAEPAYVLAAKRLPLGKPQAIAAWFYGDDSNNVWKFRLVDAKGEIFQADIGAIPSGWNYKQFILNEDTAMVSWGGDGQIDYPIAFESVVIDRQGGKAEGTGVVDEITAVASGADLFTYQFGNSLAYWKGSGSQQLELCGQSLIFTEEPKLIEGVSCQDRPKVTSVKGAESAKKIKPVKKKVAASSAPGSTATAIDPAKSSIRVLGENVPADGYSYYQVAVVLKDANDNVITDVEPKIVTDALVKTGPSLPSAPLSATTSANPKIIGPILVNHEWLANISSAKAGSFPLKVEANQQAIREGNLAFRLVPKEETAWSRFIAYLRFLYRRQEYPALFVVWLYTVFILVAGAAGWALFRMYDMLVASFSRHRHFGH